MSYSTFDTIVAIATPPGAGGIAIVRLSGPESLFYLQQVFIQGAIEKNADLSIPRTPFSPRPRYMHYGHILDKDRELLDEVLAVYMPAPASVTGENVVEVHCHGGQAISIAVLESFLALGARLASKGEFTKRAYLNDRIDLTQAEAVVEAINASTREGARLAEAKLRGGLCLKINELRALLDSLRIEMTVAVDFPDDEEEIIPHNKVSSIIQKAKLEVLSLIEAYERATLWREGALVVLAGQVNAGKSSLLNALIGTERAIVSNVEGTTRDYIEESVNIKGLSVRLIDTAGLRTSGDIVEQEGIRRSYQLAEEADLLLLVVDSKKWLEKEFSLEVMEKEFLKKAHSKANILLVLNKSDTVKGASLPKITHPHIFVSSFTGEGISDLSSLIFSALTSSSEKIEGDIAPNKRQSALLQRAIEELCLLEVDLNDGLTADILAIRVDHTVSLLDEVTGTTPDEAILDTIFSSFCIGK